MTVGELERAKRRALELFDLWNEVTGAVSRGSSCYYELEGVIEDAVHCGAQEATGDYQRLENEPLAIFRAARGTKAEAAARRSWHEPARTAPKWIRFEKQARPKDRVTDRWTVYERAHSGAPIGEVRWFGSWRRYAFNPAPGAVFEQDCLRDIAAFCEEQTAARKRERDRKEPV